MNALKHIVSNVSKRADITTRRRGVDEPDEGSVTRGLHWHVDYVHVCRQIQLALLTVTTTILSPQR